MGDRFFQDNVSYTLNKKQITVSNSGTLVTETPGHSCKTGFIVATCKLLLNALYNAI